MKPAKKKVPQVANSEGGDTVKAAVHDLIKATPNMELSRLLPNDHLNLKQPVPRPSEDYSQSDDTNKATKQFQQACRQALNRIRLRPNLLIMPLNSHFLLPTLFSSQRLVCRWKWSRLRVL
jgi:hypothetical protein